MAEKNNAKCSICDRDYYVCLACKDAMSIHPWKRFTDTSEHYKIFQIVKGYNTNMYTKDEARTKLKNVDLSDLNTFRPHIKSTIKDILKEPIVEAVIAEEVKPTMVEDEKPVVEKTAYSRKKNYKVETE